MPLFFFDIDDSVAIRDGTGQDFPDHDAAQTEAFRRAAVYGGDPANLQKSGVIVVTVRDAARVVLTVRLICQVDDHCTNSGAQPGEGSKPRPSS